MLTFQGATSSLCQVHVQGGMQYEDVNVVLPAENTSLTADAEPGLTYNILVSC